MTTRLLITGGNGQLGTELGKYCTSVGDEVSSLGSSELDITNREQTLKIIGSLRPEVILHCGAWTNVDGCETDPMRAYEVNAMGSRNVAEAAARCNAHVVGISTDYVFDGRGTGPDGGGAYSEWDATGPISGYGRSKLAGERELQTLLGPAATIVRTSWVVGEYGNNFLKTMLRLAADPERETLSVVDDQRGCPTFTEDLAPMLRRLGVARIPGVFHVSNAGPVSWFAFAQAIFTAAGHRAARVVAIPTSQLQPPRPAPRPAVSVLENAALRMAGLPAMPHWEQALARAVAALG